VTPKAAREKGLMLTKMHGQVNTPEAAQVAAELILLHSSKVARWSFRLPERRIISLGRIEQG
jgi:hypothetical protein